MVRTGNVRGIGRFTTRWRLWAIAVLILTWPQATRGEGEPIEPAPPPPFLQYPGVWQPRGDSQVSLTDKLSLGLGIQYRLMHNASNIPGLAGRTFADTERYDFFRQRLRLNLSVQPKGAAAGGFAQTEFRGGFGGGGPGESDPRAARPQRNPFNRLQARGLRYGFLYATPFADHTVVAGILPLSDDLDDTLFSADWDFNVGGLALLGSNSSSHYRLGYLRVVEGVGTDNPRLLGKDGDLWLADYVLGARAPGADGFRAGAHAYYLNVGKGLPLGGTEELWLGASAAHTRHFLHLKSFAVVNSGRLGVGVLDDSGAVVSGFDSADSHLGFAVKVEAREVLDPLTLDQLVLYSTGDSAEKVQDQYATLGGLFGTEGFWGYTHIFTANPSSDVNDLAVDPGNDGAGLATAQVRAALHVHPRLTPQLSAGWFQAARRRNGGSYMGSEIGGMITFKIDEGLTLDAGGAGAVLGHFYGPAQDNLFEIFTRLQFQY